MVLWEFQIALLGCSCGCGRTPSQDSLEATAVLGPEDLKLNIWAAPFQVCPPNKSSHFHKAGDLIRRVCSCFIRSYLRCIKFHRRLTLTFGLGCFLNHPCTMLLSMHGKLLSRISLLYGQSVSGVTGWTILLVAVVHTDEFLEPSYAWLFCSCVSLLPLLSRTGENV